MSILYNFIILFAIPFILIRLILKSQSNPEYRRNISERFAFNLPHALDNTIVFHTVSVGEFLALKPLLIHIIENSNYNLWITCTTPTGRNQIKQFSQTYPHRIVFSYLPYDFPYFVSRFLHLTHPKLFVLVETEIWPNILKKAQKYDIPTLLLNARLSEKSFQGYQKYASNLLNKPLQKLFISAQSNDDQKRLIKLGVQEQNSVVIPSLKLHIDQQQSSKILPTLNDNPQRWVWIAATTHDPEEIFAITAHKKILEQDNQALLCIAPRHPERSKNIANQIRQQGFIAKKFSKNEFFTSTKDILIIDTLGDLDHLFSQARVAFIGGSLINHGGQNPLKALQSGCSICFGPYMRNFKGISQLLLKQDFVQSTNEEQLFKTVLYLSRNYDNDKKKQEIIDYRAGLDDGIIEKHYQRIVALFQEKDENHDK